MRASHLRTSYTSPAMLSASMNVARPVAAPVTRVRPAGARSVATMAAGPRIKVLPECSESAGETAGWRAAEGTSRLLSYVPDRAVGLPATRSADLLISSQPILNGQDAFAA